MVFAAGHTGQYLNVPGLSGSAVLQDRYDVAVGETSRHCSDTESVVDRFGAEQHDQFHGMSHFGADPLDAASGGFDQPTVRSLPKARNAASCSVRALGTAGLGPFPGG